MYFASDSLWQIQSPRIMFIHSSKNVKFRSLLNIFTVFTALLISPCQADNRSDYDYTGFFTPSKNIECSIIIQNRLATSLWCSISNIDGSTMPRPTDCYEDWDGNFFSIGRYGKSERGACFGDSLDPIEKPILDYGSRWLLQDFECSSQRSGLRCQNADGHGFFLSRKSQQMF